MNRKTPIIAVTGNGCNIFESLADAAEEYDVRSSYIVKLINTGQVHRDERTTFDYYVGPMDE